MFSNQLRENIGLSFDAPIENIDQIIENAGFSYIMEDFGDEFSGFSRALGGGEYLIGFNKNHFWNENFRRFTIAHELGHLSIPLHRDILDRNELHRSKPEFRSSEEIEKEADRFAINFLAPKTTFLAKIKNRRFNLETIMFISQEFKISLYAAVLRYIELTDLSCSLIVSNKKGIIDYDKRSSKLYSSMYHPSISKGKIPQETLTFDFINKLSNETAAETLLNYWYPELPIDIKADESVFELDYINKVFTLIEPHVSNIKEYIEENSSRY